MKKKYVMPQLIGEAFSANEYVAACYACLDMGGRSNNFENIYYDENGNGILDSGEILKVTGIDYQNDCGERGSGGKLAHYITDEQLNSSLCSYVIIVRNDGKEVPAIMITERMSDKDSYGGHYPHFCDRQSNAS